MSKSYSIQKKLWKGYGKVARILGDTQYDIYRSDVLTDPLSSEKWIDRKVAAFSKDRKYGSTPTNGLSKWLCWVDGRLSGNFDLQQGDFLYDPLNGGTYFIAGFQDHHDIVAIRCNATISVNRHSYSNSGSGFAPGDTEVAASIPCYIEEMSSGGGAFGYIPAASSATDAVAAYKVYLWDPVGEIELRDAIVDSDGRRFQVLTVDTSDLGTTLICKAYNP